MHGVEQEEILQVIVKLEGRWCVRTGGHRVRRQPGTRLISGRGRTKNKKVMAEKLLDERRHVVPHARQRNLMALRDPPADLLRGGTTRAERKPRHTTDFREAVITAVAQVNHHDLAIEELVNDIRFLDPVCHRRMNFRGG